MLRTRGWIVGLVVVAAVGSALAIGGCRPHHRHHGDGGDGWGDPDLEDDGGHYHDSTAVPGRWFHIGGDVRNSGDSSSGSFTVDFYASTGPSISTSDYFLGSVTVWSIGSGDWANVDLSADFPQIPPGRYYAGWIIDAGHDVSESDESNNVVEIGGAGLLVEDRYEYNDTRLDAWVLGGPGTVYSLEGTISVDGDEDWFSFWQDDGFAIDILLSSLPDDYDLNLYADDGTLLESSKTAGTGNEHIVTTASYSGTYFIQIVGAGAAHDESNTWIMDVNLE